MSLVRGLKTKLKSLGNNGETIMSNEVITPLTLKDEEFTIAELFKKHGYRTGMMGK